MAQHADTRLSTLRRRGLPIATSTQIMQVILALFILSRMVICA